MNLEIKQSLEKPKKEYRFSSEDLLDEHVLDKVFNLPDFQSMTKFFIEERVGKISCLMTLLGNESVTIKTKEDEPISASSFEEMKDKIREWIASEVTALSEASMNTDWDIKSFSIDFNFKKDEKEEQTGYRSIINENF